MHKVLRTVALQFPPVYKPVAGFRFRFCKGFSWNNETRLIGYWAIPTARLANSVARFAAAPPAFCRRTRPGFMDASKDK